MKILLIDDEQSLIDIFTQTFKTAGFEVVGAESGNEGILKAQTEHPDMIFLDQVLPDINGNQVLQMLKQDVETKDIPIAMLSNFNQDGMVRDAINLGAIDYILKYQIDPQDLIRKANQIIGAHTKVADKIDQSNMFASASPAGTTPPPSSPNQINQTTQTPVMPTSPASPMPAQQSTTPTAVPPVDPTPIPTPPAAEPTMPTTPIVPMPEVPQADIPPMPTPSSPDPIGIQSVPTSLTNAEPTPQIPSMETLTHNEPTIPEPSPTPATDNIQTPPAPQIPTEIATPMGAADIPAQTPSAPMPDPVAAIPNGVVTPIPPAPEEPEVTPQANPTTQPTKIDS